MCSLRNINHYQRCALLVFILFISLSCFAQTTKWAFKSGTNGDQSGVSITVDKDSSVLVTGYFSGSNIDFDPSPSSSFLMSSNGDYDIFVAKYDSSGNFKWAFKVGGSLRDCGMAISTDQQGNVLVGGYFRSGPVDFDPSVSGTFNLTSNGDGGGDPGYGGDIFVAKYSPNGQFIWAFNIGGTLLYDAVIGLTTDNQNAVIVGGYFREDNVDFNPGAGTNVLNSSSGTAFVAKYNAAGQYQWAYNFGAGNVDNVVSSVAADNSGNVFITGFFQGSGLDFDPGAGIAILNSNGGYEVYTVKFNSAGQYQWAKSLGSSGNDVGRSVSVDETGNVYVVGDFMGTVSFDVSSPALTASGSQDIFLVKYTNNGSFVWAKNMGGPGTEYSPYMSVKNGAICLAGFFTGTNCDMDPSVNTGYINSNGSFDCLFAKYDYNGQYICAFALGGTGDDRNESVVSDNNGNYYCTGSLSSFNVNYQPDLSQPAINLSTTDSRDIYVFRFKWTTTPPAGTIRGDSICIGLTGHLIFTADAGVGPFTLTYTDGVNNYSQSNVQNGVPFAVQVNPLTTTTYTLLTIVDAARCPILANVNDTALVYIRPNPSVYAGTDTTVCPNTVFNLNGSGNGTFSWSPASLVNDPFIANPFSNLNIDTTFYLTVTAANGCTSIDSVHVHPRPTPFISAGNDTLVCRNTAFVLHASGTGNFSWQPASLLVNANSNSPTANISDTTKFYVTITDIYNCTNTDSVTVYTKPVPLFGLTASSNAVCPSQSVQFTATGGDIYQWQPVPGLSSISVSNPTAILSGPTTYYVTITSSACGESTVLSQYIDTLPGPIVTVSSSNEIDCFHASTQLSASGGATYQWTPIRGLSDPAIADPVAEVDVTTVFSVEVTTAAGCKTTKDITVVAAPKPSALLAGIPSAFTPNHDGINDCFGLKNWSGVSSLQMAVFNRFGEMIFYTTDPKLCWDGTYKGKPQPVDTYVYYVNAVLKCGPISKKGYVVLMR